MRPLLPLQISLVLTLVSSVWQSASALDGTKGDLHPGHLRCEYTVRPLGIHETNPRLSWASEAAGRGELQTAYQVLVASTPDLLSETAADRWNSGKVLSDESAHVAYGGAALGSRDRCCWKVRVWDRAGNPSDWSDSTEWTMGLLTPADWQARWIEGTDPAATLVDPPVTIRHAVFETPDHASSVDVAAVITGLLAAGRRSVAADAKTFGLEPDPAHPRQLHVEYDEAGQPHTATVRERESLEFGVRPAPIRYLRRGFAVNGPVARATLYVTALGLYECRLNGQRVGDHVLAPDWTDYNRRVRYQAYDVSSLVHPGENALGALVACGWYAGHLGNGGFQQYGKIPALLAQLEIVQADGSIVRVVSDGSWKSHAGPILASDFMLGEDYDARKELPAWDQPGLAEQGWTNVIVRDEAKTPRALDPQVSPAVRELSERKAIALTQPAPGQWTFDLGQNMVGVVRLKVRAPAGTRLTLRHAEMLNPDGTVYTANLRRAASTDTYICHGGTEETWQPRFTFHGFRYVELTGLPDKPADDAVTGIVLGSDVPSTGHFACSNPLINQLTSNIEWGLRGNYLSVPTDCPQRDERLGWMGDAEVFVRTATNLADVASFFTKWLVDVDDAQTSAGAFTNVAPQRGSGVGTPAWADAGVICPWTIYEAYGDRRILERHLPAMTKWVEWCREHSTNLLRDKDRGSDYGDWLALGANTPKDVIGTAYFAYSTHLVSKAYAAVGDREAAEKYGKLFEAIRAAFVQAYVAPDGLIKGDTQCDYAMALKFELLPPELRPKAVQFLADKVAEKGNHLTTGFVGVSYLLPTLADGHRLDTAYALLTQETFPSWLFSVKQGATTIWERWDGWTPEKGFQSATMNSFNHYSLGSCGEWLYDTVAGIGWDENAAGYKKMVIRPRPGKGLLHAQATRDTMYGRVATRWIVEAGTFDLEVTIPPNTTARVILPTADVAAVTEGGRPIASDRECSAAPGADGDVAMDVGSGTYRFKCPLAPDENPGASR